MSPRPAESETGDGTQQTQGILMDEQAVSAQIRKPPGIEGITIFSHNFRRDFNATF